MSMLQLIDRGKVHVKDLALEIGISPDSLNATLAVMSFIVCNQFLKVIVEVYHFLILFRISFM